MVLMNKKTMMKLALMLFLLGFTATVVDARFDSTFFITQLFSNGDASNKACCNSCPCTRSIPPKCSCSDIGETCHSACKSCLCTRSIPPQCRCTDVTNFCYKNCN
uniref:Putative trypsin inhibitor n=1 Tax=Lens culinaris subsp. orientalis TaxID=129392 RepID=Q4W2W6_LENCO|nr:putative trypsin inhibitor [Lens orientalis]